MELIITVWVPWSGKTTLYQSYKDYMYVGFDEIMKELYEKHLLKNNWMNQLETKEEMDKRTIEYLKQGMNVYYDNTNHIKDERKELIQKIRKEIWNVKIKWIYFSLPLKEIKKRNKKRIEKLGEDIIERYYNSIDNISYDEWRDEIYFIYK